jgi:genome maintenance exonuclease 1
MLINKFNYYPLSRCEVNGKRLYQTPDGHKLPSVTTILDRTKPPEAKAALEAWRNAVGHRKATEITTQAANRGTRMHKFLEDWIAGIPLNESITNPFAQQSQKMAKIVIAEGMKNVSEVWGSEVPLYFPELYAGTTDCVGVHSGDEAILDFKQTNKPKKREHIDDYFIQLTAYALAHNEVHRTNIRKGVILMCSKDFEYQEFILEPTDFDYWTERWLKRVEEYYVLN